MTDNVAERAFHDQLLRCKRQCERMRVSRSGKRERCPTIHLTKTESGRILRLTPFQHAMHTGGRVRLFCDDCVREISGTLPLQAGYNRTSQRLRKPAETDKAQESLL